jgi:MFS family permease
MATQSQQAARLILRLDRLPFSRWHQTLFVLAFVGVMFDAMDFAMFGAALPPIAAEFKLGPAEAGFLATIGLIGAFVGALVWGTISDYIGRRTAFQATVGQRPLNPARRPARTVGCRSLARTAPAVPSLLLGTALSC